jgi:hypothetical protein
MHIAPLKKIETQGAQAGVPMPGDALISHGSGAHRHNGELLWTQHG